jgi:hypothetical protein
MTRVNRESLEFHGQDLYETFFVIIDGGPPPSRKARRNRSVKIEQ